MAAGHSTCYANWVSERTRQLQRQISNYRRVLGSGVPALHADADLRSILEAEDELQRRQIAAREW